MLAFDAPERALLVSPILDMEGLIQTMMGWAGVTEDQLREQGEIATSFGQTLSWNVPVLGTGASGPPLDLSHLRFSTEAEIRMTAPQTVENYARQHNAALTVMEGGEHWFHTPQQLAVLREWEEQRVEPGRMSDLPGAAGISDPGRDHGVRHLP